MKLASARDCESESIRQVNAHKNEMRNKAAKCQKLRQTCTAKARACCRLLFVIYTAVHTYVHTNIIVFIASTREII